MGRVKYSLYDYELFNLNKHNEEKGSIRSNEMPIPNSLMKSSKFLFDYPEGFALEDCKAILEILAKDQNPSDTWRIVFPDYYIQVTFCEDNDLIFHISKKKEYGKTLVKYLKYVDYEG